MVDSIVTSAVALSPVTAVFLTSLTFKPSDLSSSAPFLIFCSSQSLRMLGGRSLISPLASALLMRLVKLSMRDLILSTSLSPPSSSSPHAATPPSRNTSSASAAPNLHQCPLTSNPPRRAVARPCSHPAPGCARPPRGMAGAGRCSRAARRDDNTRLSLRDRVSRDCVGPPALAAGPAPPSVRMLGDRPRSPACYTTAAGPPRRRRPPCPSHACALSGRRNCRP